MSQKNKAMMIIMAQIQNRLFSNAGNPKLSDSKVAGLRY